MILYKRIAAVILALVMTSVCFSGVAYANSADNTLNVIADTQLYSSADISSAPVASLSGSSVVTLLESTDSCWAKVSCNGVQGYCQTRVLTKTASSGVKMLAHTEDDLNFRTSPKIADNIIQVLDTGLYLNVEDNGDYDWAQVIYNGTSGYLSKDYLTVCFLLSRETVSDGALPNWFEDSSSNVTSISFSSSTVSLRGSAEKELYVFSSNGQLVNSSVTFTSSDSDIVSVDSSGVIKPKSNGTATITAILNCDSSVSAQCKVTVSAVVPEADTAITISASSVSIYKGNKYALTADSKLDVTWSSSNTSVATVSNGVVSAKGAGQAVISASNGYNTASCKVTVISGSEVDISSTSSTLPVGQTLFLSSATTGAVWSSSDTSIASVEQMTDKYGSEFAFVLAKKTGSVTITAAVSDGAASCLLTVTDAEPVRFAYTSPNSAALGSTVSFIAITDLDRTAVKFEYTLNGSSKTVEAANREVDGSTAVWTASAVLGSSGTYSVKAYAKTAGSSYATCSNAETTAFVTAASNTAQTSCEERRVSDALMPLLASWEGFRSNVELDSLTGSDPTVGYGRVVTVGTKFYNSITKQEAMAYLYKTVNNAGYADAVNQYMLKNEIRFNQQQYDALVCFVYNFGAYALSYYDDINSLLLNTYSGSASPGVGDVGKITGTQVRLRTGPSTDYSIITEMDINTSITLLSAEKFNNSWYYVRLSNGTEGYVHSDYASFTSVTGMRDLNNIDKDEFIQTFMPYHHASGICYWGLVYRRVDEIEMFFEGDYINDGNLNKYGYKYRCSRNSDIQIGY